MSSTMSRRQMNRMYRPRPRPAGQVLWVLLAIVVFLYIIYSPNEAAGSARQLFAVLQHGLDSFFSFLGELGGPAT